MITFHSLISNIQSSVLIFETRPLTIDIYLKRVTW